MICFTSNPSIFSSIPIYSSISSITNNPNCVLFSMAPANTVSGYYDIRKFIITANNILQHSGTNIGSGISYIDPMVSNIIFETPDFDKDLAGCIDYDVNLWISMMLIMIHAYEGYEVIIEYGTDELSLNVVESLIKIIQEKYQYNCVIINDIDDLYGYKESSFGPIGLMKLDEERKKFQELFITNPRLFEGINI